MINKPKESVPAIAKGAGECINKNIIKGDAESRARAVGALTVEILSFLAGAGAAKVAKVAKVAKTADAVLDAGVAENKLLRGVGKNIDNAMSGPGTIGMKPSLGVLGNLDDAGGTRSWYDKIIKSFDNSQGARKKVKISNKVDDVNMETLKNIQNALNKASMPENMTLYRGTTVDALGDLKNAMPNDLVGKVITENDFMSTSTKSGIANNFTGNMQMPIKAPAGSKGLNISSISQYSNESEILFQSGSKIVITSAEKINGVLHITAHLKR